MLALRAKLRLMLCTAGLFVFLCGFAGGRITMRQPTKWCLEDALKALEAAQGATLPAAIGSVRERALRAVHSLRSVDHEHARIALRVIAEAAK